MLWIGDHPAVVGSAHGQSPATGGRPQPPPPAAAAEQPATSNDDDDVIDDKSKIQVSLLLVMCMRMALFCVHYFAFVLNIAMYT